jgi:hypothetical protein
VLPWAVSRVLLGVAGPDNLKFSLKDFHNADLADAALVVCYLTGPAMEKLRPKLEAELQPGALVASNTFAFNGWQAIDTQTAPDMYRTQVYLYRVGKSTGQNVSQQGDDLETQINGDKKKLRRRCERNHLLHPCSSVFPMVFFFTRLA